MARSRSKRLIDGKRGRAGDVATALEALDRRVMLSVTASFLGGTLRVTGDDQDDVITLSRNVAGTIFVNGGAVVIAGDPLVNVLNAQTILLVGGGGNDQLSLDEANGLMPGAGLFGGDGNDVLTGGSGIDFVDGGAGDDTVTMGAGDDAFQWNPGNGSDEVDGQGGRDTMVFNGNDLAEQVGISAVGNRVRFTRDVGGVGMDLDGLEVIDFNAFGGADTITVDDQTATDVFDVNLDLSGSGGVGGDGAVDSVVINGTGGDDLGQAAGFDGGTRIGAFMSLFPFVNIVGAEAANDRLTLNAGDGDDLVDCSALLGGLIEGLFVNAGDGSDLVIGSSGNDAVDGGAGDDSAILGPGDDSFTWNSGDGSDVVQGQAGTDTLNFNGSNVDEKIGVLANGQRVRVTRDVGDVVMDVDGVEQASVAVLGGADEVVVGDLTGTALGHVKVKLGADAQADDVVVNGTNGLDAVEVGGDFANGVTVEGLAAQVEVVGTIGVTDGLTVNGLGGADVLDASALAGGTLRLGLNGGDGEDLLIGSGGDDAIDGGGGADVAHLGGGDDTFVWNPGDGGDRIDGQAGRDALVFNGSDMDEHVSISNSVGRVRFTRDVGGVAMDLGTIERVDFNALGGADSVVVNDLTGTGLTEINLNLAGAPDGTAADAQADSVVVNGSDRPELIPVQGTAGGVLVNGDFLNGTGLPFFVLMKAVGANDSLRINGNGGGDRIEADLDTPVNLSADGGAGQDTINVFRTAITGVARVLPSGGDDSVNVGRDPLTVANAAFDATQRIGALRVVNGGVAAVTASGGGGGTVLTVTSIDVTGTGRLDLGNGGLIVDYTGASPIDAIGSLLASGYNGGAWNGHGIMTHLGDPTTRALGFAEASDVAAAGTFGGQGIDGTAVVVGLTLYGDANLDGAVDFNDLVRLAQNYNSAGAGWSGGNFNYDGAVDFGDLVALAQHYNTLAAPAAAAQMDEVALKSATETSPVGKARVVPAVWSVRRIERRAPAVRRAGNARIFRPVMGV